MSNEYEFKGQPIETLRALLVRGDCSVTRLARELGCTEKDLLVAVTCRPSWNAVAATLSSDSNRELHIVANALRITRGRAVEFILATMGQTALEAALLERRRSRIARRQGRHSSTS